VRAVLSTAVSNQAAPNDDETEDIHQRLVAHLSAHSVRTGDFTLKSGQKSGWFIDSKQTACRSEGLLLMADLALRVMPPDVDAIGGLTLGADPVAYGIAAVAATRGRSLRSFPIRKEAKDHGVEGRLAGALERGDRVVITEDTVTRGTSSLEAAHVVRRLGAEAVMILVLVDRGGTCAAMAAEEGIDFRALVTAPELGFDYGS
jgi:orotate phosphoribosyltransferase